MYMSGNDNSVEKAKGIEDTVNYNVPNMITMDNSISVVESSSCSASMVDSFCPPIWNQSVNGQSLGYCEMNAQTDGPLSSLGPIRTGLVWTTNGMFLPNGPRMLPQNLPHFPTDSDFIQRAAKLSCFNGGNFSEMVNPFSIPLNPHSLGFGLMQGPDEVFVGKDEKSESVVRSHDEAKNGVDVPGTRRDEAEFSGRGAQEESSGKRKKRKKNEQKIENNEAPQPSLETAKETAEQESDQNPLSTHTSDPPKEEYIHVRARRGQATNSHSLAERVRREKISERMKFLQDLVPGCSKVTGKAVMLDEIINYVQSLQRQVEFLSMKLATVNPRLDFNIEQFLVKDQIPHHRTGLSSSLAFSPSITMPYPPLHLPHPSLIPASLPSIGNFSETLQRLPGSAVCGRFNEPTCQTPRIWDDELHNVIHNSFNSTASLNSQDLSASLPPGHMKAEP